MERWISSRQTDTLWMNKGNDKSNKNGVLWSQARMRIEMRLRCYLVTWSLVIQICN